MNFDLIKPKKNFVFNEKGQMSAPFELFVAVIIMAFVIIIGSQMLATVNREVCVNNIDKQLSDFKVNIQNTANYKNSTKFFFENPEKCFNEKEAKINVQHITKNSRLCSLICGQAVDDCYYLNFVLSKDGVSKQKCLSISKFSTFLTATAGDGCNNSILGDGHDGYNAINPQLSLPIGNYVLRNISKPGEAYPKICTFYKK